MLTQGQIDQYKAVGAIVGPDMSTQARSLAENQMGMRNRLFDTPVAARPMEPAK